MLLRYVRALPRPNDNSEFNVQTFAERRVRSALGRLAHRLRGVEVMLRDVNGPRGGIDHRCRLQLELHPSGQIVTTGSGVDAPAAIADAVRRAAAAAHRRVQRRRQLARRPLPFRNAFALEGDRS